MLTGGRSMIEKWNPPIYPGRGKECSICCREPMIRPVQLQCSHVLCNSCLQEIMSMDEKESKCPVCRTQVMEYRSLDSKRIRRPRDKSVPFQENAPYDSSDDEYVPPRALTVGEIDPQTESSDSSSEESDQVSEEEDPVPIVELSQSQIRANGSSQTNSQHSFVQAGPASQESVIIVAEYPSRVKTPEVSSQGSIQLITQNRAVDRRDSSALSSSQQPGSSRANTNNRQESADGQQEIVYEAIERVEAHRGRGPCIRYLVTYLDGDQEWQPLSHMDRCGQALIKYRRRLKVRNQQAYLLRKKAAARADGG